MVLQAILIIDIYYHLHSLPSSVISVKIHLNPTLPKNALVTNFTVVFSAMMSSLGPFEPQYLSQIE
jgi:hypothetical protein